MTDFTFTVNRSTDTGTPRAKTKLVSMNLDKLSSANWSGPLYAKTYTDRMSLKLIGLATSRPLVVLEKDLTRNVTTISPVVTWDLNYAVINSGNNLTATQTLPVINMTDVEPIEYYSEFPVAWTIPFTVKAADPNKTKSTFTFVQESYEVSIAEGMALEPAKAEDAAKMRNFGFDMSKSLLTLSDSVRTGNVGSFDVDQQANNPADVTITMRVMLSGCRINPDPRGLPRYVKNGYRNAAIASFNPNLLDSLSKQHNFYVNWVPIRGDSGNPYALTLWVDDTCIFNIHTDPQKGPVDINWIVVSEGSRYSVNERSIFRTDPAIPWGSKKNCQISEVGCWSGFTDFYNNSVLAGNKSAHTWSMDYYIEHTPLKGGHHKIAYTRFWIDGVFIAFFEHSLKTYGVYTPAKGQGSKHRPAEYYVTGFKEELGPNNLDDSKRPQVHRNGPDPIDPNLLNTSEFAPIKNAVTPLSGNLKYEDGHVFEYPLAPIPENTAYMFWYNPSEYGKTGPRQLQFYGLERDPDTGKYANQFEVKTLYPQTAYWTYDQ